MELDLNIICSEISSSLTSSEASTINISRSNSSNGVTYEIDGNKCKSNISFWPNGHCDIDYILVKNNESINNQLIFKDEKEAVSNIIKEIKEAIKRA